MRKLYASPLRVYILLGSLALLGVLCGTQLPVSLFPNSSKPEVFVSVSLGDQTAEEFKHSFGDSLEYRLRSLSSDQLRIESLKANYQVASVNYQVEFGWGVKNSEALKEVRNVVMSFASQLPGEIRDSIEVYSRNRNSGFFAMSFYSETRDLESLHKLLEPLILPSLSKVEDASDPVLWNPSSKEIKINLNLEAITSLQILPRDIDAALGKALKGVSGGVLNIDSKQMSVEVIKQSYTLEDIGRVNIPTPAGKVVHLRDIAKIEYGPKTNNTNSFRTSGAPSLILFSTPKPGGNIKKMSEDILGEIERLKPSFPKDVQYKVLVDPSQFIRSAINNVLKEVGIAALLAVIVLFVFIGSLRNVITAAIEIPLSMVLAFILMRMTGMNLNLVSLGGLALAAGMNVDASVVVMENIFRHFEKTPQVLSFEARLNILVAAVKEVQFSVIASTLSSLVVFIPLAFTSELSYAILGDLALAVVFSHGFSALVALILVPTLRLQLMSREGQKVPHSIFEKQIQTLETFYGTCLKWFLERRQFQILSYVGVGTALVFLGVFALPKFPREIIGKPDTDWLILGVQTEGNTKIGQMESISAITEKEGLRVAGDKVTYTFNQINGNNNAAIMFRLKEKKHITDLKAEFEKTFLNTPDTQYWVDSWNPSELPIPNPANLLITIRSGTAEQRADMTRTVSDLLQEKKLYSRVSTTPEVSRKSQIQIRPYPELWSSIQSSNYRIVPEDLGDLVRVVSEGRRTAKFSINNELIDITMGILNLNLDSVESMGALPINLGKKIIPMRALAKIGIEEAPAPIFRENGSDLSKVEGRFNTGEGIKSADSLAQAKKLLLAWHTEESKKNVELPTLNFEEPDKDLTTAISQLTYAVLISIGLILITLLFQFGRLGEALLVLVAVPLGILGVLTALWLFRSTLSLNSILGVILLNGIAVANSIILVDFTKKLVEEEGLTPEQAALKAARTRLRPILITSLTSILGMLPVALGVGEGGKVLQPLGIAVSGGLWVSMTLTLFFVPALHVFYLNIRSQPSIWDWSWVKSLKRFSLTRQPIQLSP